MRVVVTSDLHYNQPKSRTSADELIEQINELEADALVVVGDTAIADDDSLERCLQRFTIDAPRLFVAGNHELWTKGPDSYVLFQQDVPRRVRSMGWRWLEGDPLTVEDTAIVGNLGWYDYSFAQRSLGIPERFYAHKISPGAAEQSTEFDHLLEIVGDIPPHARRVVARWNDGRFVKLRRSDKQFLDERLRVLEDDLRSVPSAKRVIVAIHNLPFRELLPPSHSMQWDFAKAYLGSERMGELLLRYDNVSDVICGHSHFPAAAVIGHIRARSTGSGYRIKRFHIFET